MSLKLCLLLIFVVVFNIFHFSQTNIWTGSTDADWHKPCNWSLNVVPVCAHDVVIPDLATDPDITGVAHCNTWEIQGNAVVDLNSSGGGRIDVGQAGGCSGAPTDNGGCISYTGSGGTCAWGGQFVQDGSSGSGVTYSVSFTGGTPPITETKLVGPSWFSVTSTAPLTGGTANVDIYPTSGSVLSEHSYQIEGKDAGSNVDTIFGYVVIIPNSLGGCLDWVGGDGYGCGYIVNGTVGISINDVAYHFYDMCDGVGPNFYWTGTITHSGPLPPGVSFSVSAGQVTFSGIPTAVGVYKSYIRAIKTGGGASNYVQGVVFVIS